MRTFKSPMDIIKLARTDSAYPIVLRMLKTLMVVADRECQCWCPNSQGYIVELEPDDIDRYLMPVWDGQFVTIPFEGVQRLDGFFIAIAVLDNNFTLIWIVEDSPWIDGPVRAVLEENLIQ